jgi:hypothetical protein
MSNKFSSTTNSHSGGLTGGVSCGKFSGFFSRKFFSVLGRKFECIFGSSVVYTPTGIITIIINFVILTIFVPIVVFIWGIVLIKWKFKWIKRRTNRIKVRK